MSLTPKSLPTSNIVSKRSALQDSSQIFDSLGWATPISICATILLQGIWLQKHSWDTPLCEKLRDKWLGIRDLVDLSKLTLPRAYFPHLPDAVNDPYMCLQIPALKLWYYSLFLQQWQHFLCHIQRSSSCALRL